MALYTLVTSLFPTQDLWLNRCSKSSFHSGHFNTKKRKSKKNLFPNSMCNPQKPTLRQRASSPLSERTLHEQLLQYSKSVKAISNRIPQTILDAVLAMLKIIRQLHLRAKEQFQTCCKWGCGQRRRPIEPHLKTNPRLPSKLEHFNKTVLCMQPHVIWKPFSWKGKDRDSSHSKRISCYFLKLKILYYQERKKRGTNN